MSGWVESRFPNFLFSRRSGHLNNGSGQENSKLDLHWRSLNTRRYRPALHAPRTCPSSILPSLLSWIIYTYRNFNVIVMYYPHSILLRIHELYYFSKLAIYAVLLTIQEIHLWTKIFYCETHATHASAVLDVIPSLCLFVRLSVEPHACFVTKLNNALWIFWCHSKGQSV